MLVADVADDLLDEVFERDDAAHAPEFVDDHGEVLAADPHVPEHARGALGCRYEHRGLAHERLEAEPVVAPGGDVSDEVLDVQDADHVVDLLAVDGVPRVLLLDDAGDQDVDVDVDLERGGPASAAPSPRRR
jgi:hypothetical protein